MEDGRLAADYRVKNIGPEWRKLADGLLRVETLEAQFRTEWGARLEKTRREREEANRVGHRRWGYAALVFALACTLLLLTASFVLPFPPADAAALGLLIAASAMALYYGLRVYFGTPDPLPYPSNLSDRWWSTISGRTSSVQRSGPALAARHYGDVGEEAFISYLTGRLTDEYVAVRGLLVVRNLDADVIVVGPTGIWVYEVKHWSGEITCERGEWRRVKTYRQSGGRLVGEFDVLKPFDRQWAREAGAVRENLRRRLPGHPELPKVVGGGLIFTHRNVEFRQDGSCRAWAGTPGECGQLLSNSQAMPGFTMEQRLRVVDALLEWSDRLHGQQNEAPWATSSAAGLAERLYQEAVSRASVYFFDATVESSNDISEEIQEARKRAVWHPHPDDPPQN